MKKKKDNSSYQDMPVGNVITTLNKQVDLKQKFDNNYSNIKKVYDDLDTEYREFLYKYLCNNRAMNEKMPEVKNLIVLVLPIFAIIFSLFSNMISISIASNANLVQNMIETLLAFGKTATYLLVIAMLAYFVDVIAILIKNRQSDKRKVITEIISMLHDKEEA